MRYSHDQMRQAVAALDAAGEASPRAGLTAAIRHVWLSSGDWNRWPEGPRSLARGLVALGFRGGTIAESVGAMSDDEAREAAGLIRSVAADLERSAGE